MGLPPGPPEKSIFLLVARIVRYKGIFEYARAAEALKRRYPKARFLLAGYRDRNPLAYSDEEWRFIERHLEINPVGITPMYFNEGYLFLDAFPGKETQVYVYRISVFENTYEKYRGINTQLLRTVRRGLAQTHEHLKVQLVKENQELPNPATFVVASRVPCPLDSALLPIAKRSLVKYVTGLAA